MLINSESRYKHCNATEKQSIFKVGLSFCKYNGKTGKFNYHYFLVPKQLVNETVQRLHEGFGGHTGIAETIKGFPQKNHYPNMAQPIRKWVTSCEQHVRLSTVDNKLAHPPSKNLVNTSNDLTLICHAD